MQEKSNATNQPVNSELSLDNAHGKIEYQMTNDYMFRAVFQSNPKALKGLIAAVLHIDADKIVNAVIQNPIVLGESISNKEFRLDINVLMNDNTLINLEMQLANKFNWQNRSLSYMCRSYDQLEHGDDYLDAKPVIHIGFLDYTLFDDYPEFCACYKFMNTKNHHVYNDNLTLYVVDLSKIDLATEEDEKYGITHWASLFKATTWEEIRKMATIDECLEEAMQEMRKLNADAEVRKRCRDRLEYYQDLKLHENLVKKWKAEAEDYKAKTEDFKTKISEKDNVIAERDETIANLQSENSKKLAEKDEYIRQLLEELKKQKDEKNKL